MVKPDHERGQKTTSKPYKRRCKADGGDTQNKTGNCCRQQSHLAKIDHHKYHSTRMPNECSMYVPCKEQGRDGIHCSVPARTTSPEFNGVLDTGNEFNDDNNDNEGIDKCHANHSCTSDTLQRTSSNTCDFTTRPHYTSIPIPPYVPPRTSSFSSSFLKSNAKFTGFQESGRQQYRVHVKLAEVNIETSAISGFLTIHDLTETSSEITTFFIGEIIGPRYSFETKHQSWGTNLRTDVQHWARFPSWRALNIDVQNDINNSEYYNEQAFQQETVFMRWKEMFLCPDANVKQIKGASFAGFYYICFNQILGSFTGLYYHQFTDRFQQLNLSCVQDGGIKQIYQYM